jgi:hypothetical protein
MSTTALRIIELVKSLPLAEQRAIRDALNGQASAPGKPERPLFLRDADGNYYNPEGIPNEDPIFKILEEIEEERHRTPARPLPPLD